MFIDKAKIHLKAGKGGDGAVAFRKEKYVPAGGPSGGDGGKGGDIVFVVDEGMKTLMDFRYKKHYSAINGDDGSNRNMFGKAGSDLILRVPPGTIIKDEQTGETIADLTEKNDKKILVKGGHGGKGNANFATSTRQAPRFSKPGGKGEELTVLLELKLIADVGLIGFPNVGKSTLLSVVTSANPKIANYHFTTIIPNLGLVKTKHGDSFVIADIPGLIEGAHQGVGLGHAFLRHVERTKLLIHVLDIAAIEGREPIEDYKKINEELKLYNEKLATRKQIIAANKMDITNSDEKLNQLKEFVFPEDIKVFPISAVTGKGITELMVYAAQELKEIEKYAAENHIEEVAEEKVYTLKKDEAKLFEIEKENDVYIIKGDFIKRLLNSTNLEDTVSLAYFQKIIKKHGVNEELKKNGAQEGDTVRIDKTEFEFFDS
ncbi:MAG: GTPase ObgE [Clostridiales bacterium]|nr:GTPase ObgE [Clostridiales bacterium]